VELDSEACHAAACLQVGWCTEQHQSRRRRMSPRHGPRCCPPPLPNPARPAAPGSAQPAPGRITYWSDEQHWQESCFGSAYKLCPVEVAWHALLDADPADVEAGALVRAGLGGALFGIGDLVSQVRAPQHLVKLQYNLQSGSTCVDILLSVLSSPQCQPCSRHSGTTSGQRCRQDLCKWPLSHPSCCERLLCPAQALAHPGELAAHFNGRELMWLVALGAVLEGFVEPWWRALLNHCMRAHGTSAAPKVRTLRFLLNTLVWTPLCCEGVFLVEHLFVHGHAAEYLAAPGAAVSDLLATLGMQLAPKGLEEGESVLGLQMVRSEGELAEDVEASSAWDAAAQTLARFVPPPLRPLARSVASASSWTLLDWLEP
jgi:hypothetical protein